MTMILAFVFSAHAGSCKLDITSTELDRVLGDVFGRDNSHFNQGNATVGVFATGDKISFDFGRVALPNTDDWIKVISIATQQNLVWVVRNGQLKVGGRNYAFGRRILPEKVRLTCEESVTLIGPVIDPVFLWTLTDTE